jgi:ABC-type uncharacterized transport system involved in gliding motility auxiliary subunit
MSVTRKDVFSTAAWAGGALALSGLVRYYVQNEWTKLNLSLAISGAVLLLAAAAGNFREILRFFQTRGGRLGTNTSVLVLGFLAILGLLNFLGFRHAKQWDWTPEKLFTLSDETKKVVGGLKQDVRVIRFEKPTGVDTVGDTLGQYRKVSGHMSYQLVDPQERPDIARQYGVQHMGDVVVVSGNRTEHLKDTDEQSITSAILKVTREKLKTVCFVTGHGERSLSGTDAEGYSTVQKALERDNYVVKPINLVESKGVPEECDLAAVAGPKTAYFPDEVESLKKYLDGGGKVLVMVDPDTDPKLDGLLSAWNVALGRDLALDLSGAGRLFGLGASVPVVTHYGAHAITEGLESQMTLFPLAQTVGAAKKDAQPAVTDLLLTSPSSFAKKNWTTSQKELRFDENKDQRGPLTLGVAAERTQDKKTARLVVIGNSFFPANNFFGVMRDGDLFLNSVNWLAQDENLISIRPKSPTNRRVIFTMAQQVLFYWFSLALVPGFVLITGAVLWWKRR